MIIMIILGTKLTTISIFVMLMMMNIVSILYEWNSAQNYNDDECNIDNNNDNDVNNERRGGGIKFSELVR